MKRFARLVPLLGVLMLAGCRDGTAPVSMVGTWNLVTVNGAPLPFVLQPADPKIEVTSDRFIFVSAGTFTEDYTFRITNGTTVTSQSTTIGGTYTVSGATVHLVFSDGDVFDTTVSGGTMTLTGNGVVLLYNRQ